MIKLDIKFHKPTTKQGAIMKKILIIMTIIISTSLMAQIRISADMAGTTSMSASGVSIDFDSKLGFTLGYDHILGNASGLDYGAGLEYQLNRGVEIAGVEVGKFGFTSVYGVGNYNINESMYAGARVGFALMFSGDDDFSGDADLKGGLMYGVHFGYNINEQMGVAVGYNSNAGTADSGMTMDVSYTRLGISFLYSL